MSFKDWVLAQLVSRKLASARPLSTSEGVLSQESPNEEYENRACTTNVAVLPASSDTSYPSNNKPGNHSQLPSDQVINESSCRSSSNGVEKNPIARIEQLQIKFLRVLHRLGLSQDNIMVSKVLYRIHLATMIRARESDLKRGNIKIERAREIAAFGQPELDFSFKVLLLGKTGVGKSSMINSIFDQNKATTNAFHPGTKHVQEITGTVKGVKITFIDTPGLLPSSPSTARRNRKILRSVKRYIRKNPPDLVLYFERLDLINMGYNDFPLLRLVTDVFGPAIWFNTILVMTHSSSALPEGPHGYPVTFESYIAHCTDLVQHNIHQAVSDTKLENPVILVENHPHCPTNDAGEKLLPNGQAWMFQFLLTCICTKVLGDVSTMLDFENSIELGPSSNVSRTRLPSLPHLLSSFLKHHAQLTQNGEEGVVDEVGLLESDEEDEYDQLPPIRVLTKAQYEKLSPRQKNDYLDELDYRETLYLKKQIKEESRRRREALLSAPNEDSDGQQERLEPVLLPDMDIPPSFGSDCPVHRYRCLTSSDKWLARPVLDPHGWDHDVSFDGINLETTAEVTKNIFGSVTGQMSKDKQDFSIQSKCTAAYSDPLDPRGSVYALGLDIQSASASRELICSVHGNTRARILNHNTTECGISLTSFGGNYFLGTKVEDSLTIGKRLKFTVSGSRMGGAGQAALGGSFGATLRGRDYPVRNETVSFTMTLMSFKKETVLSGNLQSDFRLSRGTNVSVNANLNSQKMGQVSIKISSCEHIEIAFIAVFSVLRGLFRRKVKDHGSTGTLETESTL